MKAMVSFFGKKTLLKIFLLYIWFISPILIMVNNRMDIGFD